MEDIEITCPNCKASLDKALKRVLMAGTSVTCENCGIVLVPKLQGEPAQAPAEKAPEPPSARQAIKQAFREAKASIAAELHRTASPTTARPPETPRPPRTTRHPEPASPQGAPGAGQTPSAQYGRGRPTGSARGTRAKPGTPEYSAYHKWRIEKAKKDLRSFNEASLVLMKILLALFYIGSIGSLLFDAFTGRSFFNRLVEQAPMYITGAFLYWYETRRIHEWVKQGVLEFYGVDMIVVGIVGCTVFGIGALMIVKGFVVMGIMIRQDKIQPRTRRDALISWINGLDEVSWYVAALVAADAFIIAASLVLGGMFSLLVPSIEFIALIIMGIFGIVAANNDLRGVSKYCREYKFENLGWRALVNGVIGCICLGAGTPMIIKAILLFVLDGVDKKGQEGPKPAEPVEAPLPRHEPSLPAPLVAVGLMANLAASGPVGPASVDRDSPAREQGGPTVPEPAPAVSKPIARPAKNVPTLPPKSPTSVEAFLQRSFSVLTPRARKRLLKLKKLGVSDDGIEAIAEELVHHPEFEQVEIIDEYIQLNKADEVDPAHVLEVRNMNYDENTKKWMLDQLRTIPDKDVQGFIEGMKNAQPAR